MKPYPTKTDQDSTAYLRGFMLALLLTMSAFGLVYVASGSYLQPIDFVLSILPHSQETIRSAPRWLVIGAILFLAVLQSAVHLRYFLHLRLGSRQSLNIQFMLFALVIIFIIVCGTLWIMRDLRNQMSTASPGGGIQFESSKIMPPIRH